MSNNEVLLAILNELKVLRTEVRAISKSLEKLSDINSGVNAIKNNTSYLSNSNKTLEKTQEILSNIAKRR